VEIEVTYLNPNYALSNQAAKVVTGTGLLEIFRINPKVDGPLFIGRWDGGSREPGKKERYDLDIDIEGVSPEEKRRFMSGKGGYSGHHTIQIESDRGRKYHVSLCIPGAKIFDGSVCFNVLRKIGFEATL